MKKVIFITSILLSTSIFSADLTFAIGEWPPFTGKNEPNYGVASKKVSDICDKAKLKCEFKFMSWKRALVLAQNGKYDATFPWKKANPKGSQFDISPKFITSNTVFFYTGNLPKGSKKDLSKLKSKKPIGVYGYTDSERLKKSGIKIHMVNTSETAWKMLEAKRVNIFVDDKNVGKRECQKYTPNFCEKIKVSEAISSNDLHIFFTKTKDDSKLINIQKFLQNMN